jgi:TonB family protein
VGSGILYAGMPANANTLSTAPANRNVREFLAICARHNVPYGDLSCLPVLLRELNANKHFAMHFWSAVAGMTEKHAAGTDAALAAIVEAVTGRTVGEAREAGPAHRILVERLGRMLNGQDLPADDLKEVAAGATPSPRLAELPQEHSHNTSFLEEEQVLPIRSGPRKPHRVEKRLATEREARSRMARPTPASGESPRLVLMPESDSVVAPAVPVQPAPVESKTRMVTPLISEEPVIPLRHQAGAVPLSSYADTTPRRSVAAGPMIGLLVAIFVAGSGYVILRHGGSEMWGRASTAMRAGYGSAISTWHTEPAQTAVPTAEPSAPTARPAVPADTPVPTALPANSTSAPPSASQPLPIDKPGVQAPPERIPGLTPSEKMAAAAASHQDRTPPSVIPIPDETGSAPVSVPEATMNAHLLVSRVPVLPDEVRQSGVSGVVRMQALINKSGYVSRLHVLEGPTELRHPALEAVTAWRYRPYLVDGQPVDVSTTISVDFSSLE